LFSQLFYVVNYKLHIAVNECSDPVIPYSALSNTKDKYVYQDTVNITCNTGYTIQGQGQIQCQANSTWTNPPICKSE